MAQKKETPRDDSNSLPPGSAARPTEAIPHPALTACLMVTSHAARRVKSPKRPSIPASILT